LWFEATTTLPRKALVGFFMLHYIPGKGMWKSGRQTTDDRQQETSRVVRTSAAVEAGDQDAPDEGYYEGAYAGCYQWDVIEGGFRGKGEGEMGTYNLDCQHCSAQAEEYGAEKAKRDAATCKEVRKPACYGR
jgi:hypothetical protein